MEKIAFSVLLKLFINGNEKCYSTIKHILNALPEHFANN